MKILTYYLPQFHEIPENSKKWGEGFTEWDNVKNGKKLFINHYQPRIPLNKNYYNLLDGTTMEEQCRLAKEYGIYGFCFYHYWFGDKKLLEQPMERYLSNANCDLPFCISWANESWTNIWKADSEPEVFIEQKYFGRKEWRQHFEYLLQFFNDDRYIKEGNKPIVVIYRPYLFDGMRELMEYWNQLAIEEGFQGIYFISQRFERQFQQHASYKMFEGHIQYYPYRFFHDYNKKSARLIERIIRCFIRYFRGGLMVYSYDEVWRYILQDELNEKDIPGAFVDWDNSARTGKKGTVVYGATPKKFKKYLLQQICRALNKKKDYLFMFAWNEWGEGGYLEPDERYQYQYLQMLRDSIEICEK